MLADLQFTAALQERLGSVAGSIVSEHALDLDTELGKPLNGPVQKRDGASLTFIGQNLDVSQARIIVHADMNVFPTRTFGILSRVSGDAVTRSPEAP